MAPPISFVDVETTGLTNADRVVTIGILHFEDERMLAGGTHSVSACHLIFNPGRPSHPRARQVHGYSDKDLAHQDPFADAADQLMPFFTHGGKVVAHNASFDRSFIWREFQFAKKQHLHPIYHCTMLHHRSRHSSPAGLDAILTQMGQPPRTGRHGALQDAWHAMQVYCWQNGLAVITADDLPTAPFNYRPSGTVTTF